MNILVSGLTGSGKTTFSKLLSKDLNLSFVSGSEIRSRFASGKVPAEARKYWLFSAEAVELDRLRLSDSRLDMAIDDYLRELVLTKSKQVFDVWFLPWLTTDNTLKIWLECSLEERAGRIHRALGMDQAEFGHIYQKTSEKDARAQQFAYQTYGIDILTDRSPFTVIISTEFEGATDLIRNVLNRIAENYFQGGTSDQRLKSPRNDEFTSIIHRCPLNLYPT
jgi:cytidylate kinase